ncbi:hypothetical protein H4R33_003895 [Dimargaris cristalligena]|uniref:Coatomer subunit alpha n=1 Tax=Dimargaris cristalligena TaxID=215637 RepID=A0A4P9ZVS3_9FUNG|nr:hypothetical protein H4R33_003895 [Dimargaris cristalligena]RKP36952.1 coatomer WD associated region-domain-containing protein [Dimargaris cristalligena]|eukprot:RKP36952.1 coatomer WD associated region-domain-containing protein [Dimargaris cristalligena]
MQMLTKFETKSNRVKGLAFHPKRPWILAALHNGCIQLWDYRMGTLLERFDEHEGPVRGVAFHPTQNLFVTGGDDFKIKVWNHKTRRCLFTLNGHMDYIRTVAFHHELPWILSASDDQTIRIWNWQSRQCIAILPGHTHYVMSAQFHPRDDLIVSACLDETIRVWDYSGLRKKNSAGAPPGLDEMMHPSHRGPGGQADIFGNTDVYVKFVLEGHTRGVNWASFHPTLPLIVSGGDDRQVKLWRMNDAKAWEVDTCRGHFNNVSCVLFHPRQDMIISDSEDRTIRVWDNNRRTLLQTFHRDQEKFWILAAHPEINLFAAGHDGGLMVFKLERERPAFAIHQRSLFFVKGNQVRYHDYKTTDGSPVVTLRQFAENRYNQPPRTLSYNPAENSLLITYSTDGGVYELYTMPGNFLTHVDSNQHYQRGSGGSAVWISRNRFAVLDSAHQQILVKDLSNATTKTIKCPQPATEIFAGPGSTLLISTPTAVLFYDIQQKVVQREISVAPVKYVVWNSDMSMVALLCKHTITLATKGGEQVCQISETIRIKSGAWDENGVFIYTTLNHLKYCLPQGDNGIIRTLENPIYLTCVQGRDVHCLDRDAQTRVITIDPTEYRFKLALVNRNYEDVVTIIRRSNLVGQSIIAYLQKKGYPEIALNFVKEHAARFELAIACGNMEIALETAKAMDKEEYWVKLASEALRLGRVQIVEMAYQRVKRFDHLSFLYLITGNTEKLQKMMKIAEIRGDAQSRFHNALYLGDVEERIRVLKELRQFSLAYTTAKAHGLEEEAESILQLSGVDPATVQLPVGLDQAKLFTPAAPIVRQTELNWPQLAVSKGIFENMFAQRETAATGGRSAQINLMDEPVDEIAGDWGGADDLDLPGFETAVPAEAQATGRGIDNEDEDMEDAGGWGIDEDLRLQLEADMAADTSASVAGEFVAPAMGTRESDLWPRNSSLPVDHVAAGAFDTAMKLLKQQIGVIHFEPLKSHFMTIFQATQTELPVNLGLPALTNAVRRTPEETEPRRWLPVVPFDLSLAIQQLQDGYKKTTGGRFQDAMDLFKQILLSLIFTLAPKKSDADETHQLIRICQEYLVGLKMELARQELMTAGSDSIKRVLELAAYFSHSALQPMHQQLALRSAMVLNYKQKNFQSAANFARRLLELAPAQAVANQARQIQTICDRNSRDEIPLEYDQYNPFVMCAATYTPLYKNSPVSHCSYCQAAYKQEFNGEVCRVCEIAEIGGKGTGLRLS